MTATQPDVRFIPCSTFGGGWIVPLSDAGGDACLDILDDEPGFLDPIQAEGYVIEPQDVGDVVLALRDQGMAVTL